MYFVARSVWLYFVALLSACAAFLRAELPRSQAQRWLNGRLDANAGGPPELHQAVRGVPYTKKGVHRNGARHWGRAT